MLGPQRTSVSCCLASLRSGSPPGFPTFPVQSVCCHQCEHSLALSPVLSGCSPRPGPTTSPSALHLHPSFLRLEAPPSPRACLLTPTQLPPWRADRLHLCCEAAPEPRPLPRSIDRPECRQPACFRQGTSRFEDREDAKRGQILCKVSSWSLINTFVPRPGHSRGAANRVKNSEQDPRARCPDSRGVAAEPGAHPPAGFSKGVHCRSWASKLSHGIHAAGTVL